MTRYRLLRTHGAPANPVRVCDSYRTGRHTIQAKVNAFEQVMHGFGSAPANETVVADPAVARAAFTEAVRRRPGKVIILRQKSRVLADSRR